jgi:formiminoglutamase
MKLNSKQGRFSFNKSDETWKAKNSRDGEVKLSEKMLFGDAIKSSTFVILGISEDIGPQLNKGFAGANIGFTSFLSAIQNVQSNSFIQGSEIGVLGEIIQNEDFTTNNENRNIIDELDEFLIEILNLYLENHQTLITIGGGHNNAYPLLKYTKESRIKSVHAINIDPHADCRMTDYRHSGNPFSYAFKDGYLNQYSVLGLHESYNNQFILDFINSHDVSSFYFEDYLDDETRFWKHIEDISQKSNELFNYTLDLDIDAIAFAPSSALTPSGFSIEDGRRIIRKLSSNIKFQSFHLPEGAPKTDTEIRNYSKMITYFVMDFIKCQNKLKN